MWGKLEFILPRRACKHLETVPRRSAIPEEGDKHFEVDISEKGKRRPQPEPPLASSRREGQNGARVFGFTGVHFCASPLLQTWCIWPIFFLLSLCFEYPTGEEDEGD